MSSLPYTNGDFSPPAFAQGLENWSRTTGEAGTSHYGEFTGAVLIPNDPDLGSCVEVTTAVLQQKFRCFLRTPLAPGRYLRCCLRFKQVSGPMANLEVASRWIDGDDQTILGLKLTGPEVTATNAGTVYETIAIFAATKYDHVDGAWKYDAVEANFGFNINAGAPGAVVRIADMVIEDVSPQSVDPTLAAYDVRDFGAVGDGVTDNRDAFLKADAAANGRTIIVPEGDYALLGDLELKSDWKFVGRLSTPTNARVEFEGGFDFEAYYEAFKDGEIALRKALQALINYPQHVTVDLGGREIMLSEPLDVHAAVGNRDVFANRRVLRNGKILADDQADWSPDVVAATGTYQTGTTTIASLSTTAGLVPGMLVEGDGVGREVYVVSVDAANASVTLNQQLHSAASAQSFTFTRFKYLLDFLGFDDLKRIVIEGVEFWGRGVASGIMLPPEGIAWHISDCWFLDPGDRAITSIDGADSGLAIDGCEFLSNEGNTQPTQRKTIAITCSGNDAKIRNNRAMHFRHFAVLSSGSVILTGNHFFQDDNQGSTDRTAGIVLAKRNNNTSIVGNYIDNSWIEWTNEHEPDSSGAEFGNLAVTGNRCLADQVTADFAFLKVAPWNDDMTVKGLSVTANTFKVVYPDNIDAAIALDEANGSIDPDAHLDVTIEGNAYHRVDDVRETPAQAELTVAQGSESAAWTLDMAGRLPFGAKARRVMSLVSDGVIRNAGGTPVYAQPHILTGQGANGDQVQILWPEPVSGAIRATVRIDAVS